ncbi:MAG: hypothetical protein WA786_09395 [Acidimicrobiales bacterium]
MKIFRLVGALLVIAALGWSVARATAATSTSPTAAQCSTAALSEGVNGAFRVLSVQSFGCAGNFAYLWATVGTNEANAIGVTEVLRFTPSTQRWKLVSRLKYCHPTTLPTFVYRQGCFSN